jgi:hypothetical protein
MNAIPPTCQPLADKLDHLRSELAGAQIGPAGTDNQKAADKRYIDALKGQIQQVTRQLQACILNPPATPPPPVPHPVLFILGIEPVQCLQRSGGPADDLRVRLVAGKRTAVRVYVDAGVVPAGHDEGAGPDRWPNVTGQLKVTDSASGATIAGAVAPLNPGGKIDAHSGGSPDRNDRNISLNFELPLAALLLPAVTITARVWVQGHENEPGGWTTSRVNTFNFETRQTQAVTPILIGDGIAGVGPPSMSAFSVALLQGALPRYPMSQLGFVLNPALSFTTSEDLRNPVGWFRLIGQLTGAILLSTPPGIRAGVVPPGTYPFGGIGFPRVLFDNPAFVVNVADTIAFAHEMGHTFGIYHSRCRGDEPDPIDGRLPLNGRTDEVGMDVASGTPFPIGVEGRVIPVGTPEIMSYCRGGEQWPSTVFYSIIFDTPPF